MDVDFLVLVCDVVGHFEKIPLLDTLEGRHSHQDVINALDQHATEEEEG